MSTELTPWDSLTSFVQRDGALTPRAQLWLQIVLEQLNASIGGVEAVEALTTAYAIGASGVIGASLTATDAGSDVMISVPAHTRIYGDGTSISVDASDVTGLNYSTVYYVFYSDPDRVGGAITLQASSVPADAMQANGIHSVGTILTPAAAAPDTTGLVNPPAGLVYLP